jgi:hypothetical protein
MAGILEDEVLPVRIKEIVLGAAKFVVPKTARWPELAGDAYVQRRVGGAVTLLHSILQLVDEVSILASDSHGVVFIAKTVLQSNRSMP